MAQFGFSQHYAYSFSGDISSDQISQIEERCAALPEVTSAKLRYKDDSHKGEVFVHVEPNNSQGEARLAFSAADLKKVLQSFGLSPIDFIELKTK